MRKRTVFLAGIGVTATYFALDYLHRIATRDQAIAYANSFPPLKLNIGAAGKNQPVMETAFLNNGTKCDICPDYSRDIEFCNLADTLPYPSKSFEVVFVSHVIEHIPAHRVLFALLELDRISNNQVVIVLPHPLSLFFYLASGHKSLIYKVTYPYYGISVKNNSWQDGKSFAQNIILNQNKFKIYQ